MRKEDKQFIVELIILAFVCFCLGRIFGYIIKNL